MQIRYPAWIFVWSLIKMNGKVKFFNEKNGYGFVTAEDGKEYFVHSTGLAEGVRIAENDDVTFEIVQSDRGPKADNVQKV
jgi:CspA family cold shock protein